MLGSEVVREFRAAGAAIIATDIEVDITKAGAVRRFWDEQADRDLVGRKIDWVVNCAAWTAVDAAEENEQAATALNCDGPRILADEANRRGAGIVHLSTDYVFGGSARNPYLPTDTPAPCGVYGRTKYEGEKAIREATDRHIIIRTAWLYGAGGPNFVFTMLRLMRRNASIGVVADQRGAPTYAPDLARAVRMMVMNDHPSFGTFHFTNAGETTWHGFATAIFESGSAIGILEDACQVKPLSSVDYPTKAQRPEYSVLDTTSTRALGIPTPEWRASLDLFLHRTFVSVPQIRLLASGAVRDMDAARAAWKSGFYKNAILACYGAMNKNLRVLVLLRDQPPNGHDLTGLAYSTQLRFSNDERRLLTWLSVEHDRAVRGFRYDGSSIDDMAERCAQLCQRLRRHPVFSIVQGTDLSA